ncbi:MAG TPA: ABC transporter permease [Gemmatimonadaceae bacterium]|nr:ABC transporter permease [Gemmatimonadaceae bacterium]
MQGLWRLIWIEIKVFFREPMGAFGTVIAPVLILVLFGRIGTAVAPRAQAAASTFFRVNVPVFVAILIAINAVVSLVSIMSIYRESGILKRLSTTPLRPQTILTAHVIVKLLLTSATLALTFMFARESVLTDSGIPLGRFTVAMLIATASILSVGFVIASIVPTARFAQPITSILLYPMIAVSGLFVPMSAFSPSVRTFARLLPLTPAVSLLQGIWKGNPWSMHLGDIGALALVFVICTALSAKIFRWE